MSIHDGLRLHQEGKLDSACAVYEAILMGNPRHLDALNLMGAACHQQGHIQEAISWMMRAVEVEPSSALAHGNLSAALKSAGCLDESLRHALRAVELSDSSDARSSFCACAMGVELREDLPGLRNALARAISEPWTRPSLLSTPASSALLMLPAAKHAFDAAHRAWPQTSTPENLWGPDYSGMVDLAADELASALLRCGPVLGAGLERMLLQMRRSLLTEAFPRIMTEPRLPTQEPSRWTREPGPLFKSGLSLLCSLAAQCFANEYVWSPSPAEARLQSLLEGWADGGFGEAPEGAPPDLALACLAALTSLATWATSPQMMDGSWAKPCKELVVSQAGETLTEERLKASIERMTPIGAGVSSSVRTQYETNPYPRWVGTRAQPSPLDAWGAARRQFPEANLIPPAVDGGWRILIAGCGSGQHPCEVAMAHPLSHVLAIDLSLSSLAYGRRMADKMGLSNITFAQADISLLDGTGDKFDMAESVGCLHHMSDPEAGLGRVLSLCKPGAIVKIGLYSSAARKAVAEARALVATLGLEPNLAGLRKLRQRILDGEYPSLSPLAELADFYSASEWRDLAFHAHESCFDVARLVAMLARYDLDFLGFQLDQRKASFFTSLHGPGADMLDLRLWDAAETAQPSLFIGMYQFYVQKKHAYSLTKSMA